MADGIAYELLRLRTRDGDETTVYLVRHPLATARLSVMRFPEPTRLDHWCVASGHPEAMVAGFFLRDPYRPLGEVRIGGDLLQAGPLLVHDGRPVIDSSDPEGFSAGSAQFDSDITVGRYPRCALGVGDGELLAVCCDGRRSGVDSGLELAELARLMISFGAREAINLDGGGSATLVHRGHLLNRPYSSEDQPAPASRPIVTALLFA